LTTAGSDLDVYITVAYQEIFDPADLYTQGGINKFTRTSEHTLVQDGTAVPPADGSVIVLARVHLNSSGAIGSGTAIDPAVRTLSSAAIAPQAVGTTQLANASVTLAKLANDAQPLAVKAANAITVVTDNTLKQITVGENHSARTDNPHVVTATQIDAQGGANQIVAQINAGNGTILRSRVQTDVVSGTVTFQNLGTGMEMFSNDIDPGFGPGPIAVQLALDDAPTLNVTSGGDTNYFRAVQLRSEINRTNGHFKVFATRNIGSLVATVTVRWYAFKPTAGAVDNISVGVTVSPPSATVISNTTQAFTAVVSNTSMTGVTWKILENNGGTLSGTTANSTTYSPPGVSGPYTLQATSVSDGNAIFKAKITVNADITVTIGPNSPTVIGGDPVVLTATVINTPNPALSWSAPQGGALSATTGASVTYTPPTAPGNYQVVALSLADNKTKGICNVTVPPVSISIQPDQSTVVGGGSTIVRATITGTHNPNANWFSMSQACSVSPAVGPTTTWFGPGLGGSFDVKATAQADPNQVAFTNIFVPPIKSDVPPGGGGPGKFAPNLETLPKFANPAAMASAPAAPDAVPAADASAAGDAAPSDQDAKAKAFVRPKKRASPKLPPPTDE
jgi:hypothetical protein